MRLTSPTGYVVEIPIGGSHEPLEAWLSRGWRLPADEIVLDAGFIEVAFAPRTIDGPPPLASSGQDDVAHGADAPNVTC